MLAATGELVSEKAGVLNMSVEGMMLTGAFAGAIGSWATGSPMLGLAIALVAVVPVALLQAWLSISLRANQIVTGIGINILVLGATTMAYREILGRHSRTQIPGLDKWAPPGLGDIPVFGEAVFLQTWLLYAGLVVIALAAWVLRNTAAGLAIRAVGAEPRAVDKSGLSVTKVRYAAVLFTGFMSALAGCFLSIGDIHTFTEGMTNGAGYLALSARAELEGAEGVAPATLRISTDTRFQSALIEFGAENARPRALFSQAALGPFAGLDAPVTMNVSVGMDRQAGVNRFEGDIIVGEGSADVAGDRLSLSGGRLHGHYDIESDELIIDQISLAGDRTRIGGDIRVSDVSAIMRAAPNEPAAFNVSLPSMRVDVPGTFSEPLAITNVHIVGSIVSAERSVTFTQITARAGEGTFNGTGRLYWADVGERCTCRPAT